MVSGQSDALSGRGLGYLKRYGGNAHKLTRQENCGKGTIRSVHSRFRPIGDGGVALSNHVGGTWFDSRVVSKETCSDRIHRTTSSDNNSIFLSDLSARPRVVDGRSRDSRKRGSGYLKRLEKRDGGRAYELSRQQKILRRIVSEPIPLMAQIMQQLDDETVESTKEYLRNLITMPERIYEFVSLQNRLDERSDLTNQTLLNCHKIQLEFLVSIRTCLGSFLSENTRLLTSELVEIFLLERCRNINCRRLLPIEDRGCKICSTKKGFCSECMCLVCLKFDCANNTCSWVGCDACLHWCHAVCGIRRNLIKPGPSLKGPSGTTGMQFYCLGCGHASEMFGFIKDMFMSCANEWGEETLMKELDYVRKIFQWSEDFKGKELHVKADVLHTKLVTKMISLSDACNFIFQFFSAIKTIEDEWSVKRSKKDEVDSLGSIVRIKEAEARMFQSRAADARGEAVSLRRLARLESMKLNEAYYEKLSKLCLQETGERRRKKLEDLKTLENAHSDYCEMKMRLGTEVAGLLNRMEATKQLLHMKNAYLCSNMLVVTLTNDIMVSGQSDALRGRCSGYLKRYGGNAHKLTRQENCGKGTIRSVHSRFRPIGDGGVALSNHVGGTWFDSRVVSKETCSDRIHRTTSSDNNSIFLSDLSARPRVVDGRSRDSRKRGSGYLKRLEKRDRGRAYELSRQQKILRRIVSEPIPLMAQIMQQLDDKTVESTKEYLRNLITMPERIYEFVSLQNRLDERSDLTNQTLLNCHKIQLEFLVSIRTGLGSFLSENTLLLTSELVEIFLLERCRNINCRRFLPIEDRGCKICSTKKGFCSECMCLVCLKFDCANNTCSWVGCDACLHWCHAVCGIRRNLIKPGPSLKGPSGTTEMQFYCLGCGHASEMFGFVKDVFMSCSNEWGEETLLKELDYVRKIFQGSEDLKGKELHVKADVLHTKLVTKMISPSDACDFIFQFFSTIKTIEDEWPVKRSKKDEVDSLGSIVRIKEAEARLFQSRATDARGEAVSLRRLARLESMKLNEAYHKKLSKLCLQETEERRRKKLEDLKTLENAHSDYCEMKMRLDTEVAGLLNRMEAAKQLLV